MNPKTRLWINCRIDELTDYINKNGETICGYESQIKKLKENNEIYEEEVNQLCEDLNKETK